MNKEILLDRLKILPTMTFEWVERKHKDGLLSDDDLLKLPETLVLYHRRFPVGIHEIGHYLMAKIYGWFTKLVTVIPNGNSAGSTEATPSPTMDQTEVRKEAIGVSAGGEMAEDIAGIDDHSGCGYDRSKQRMLASGGLNSFLSEQRSKARSYLGSIGLGRIEEEAMHLVRVGTLA